MFIFLQWFQLFLWKHLVKGIWRFCKKKLQHMWCTFFNCLDLILLQHWVTIFEFCLRHGWKSWKTSYYFFMKVISTLSLLLPFMQKHRKRFDRLRSRLAAFFVTNEDASSSSDPSNIKVTIQGGKKRGRKSFKQCKERSYLKNH